MITVGITVVEEEEDIVVVNEAIEAIVVTIEVEEGEVIAAALTMTVAIEVVATEVVLLIEVVSEEAHEGVTVVGIEVADTEALDTAADSVMDKEALRVDPPGTSLLEHPLAHLAGI